MSKYTTELRWPIEQALLNLGLDKKEENWPQIYWILGLNDYPIFDETYRETLNNKIIRRYYFREIGFETLGLFANMMRRTMFEIMPYYNQMYKSMDLITDPLESYNRNYSETWTADRNDTTASTDDRTNEVNTSSETDTSNQNVFQDTPMNGLDTGAIKSMDYATNVTFDDGTEKSTSKTTGTSNDKYDKTYTGDDEGTRKYTDRGFSESQSKLLLQYRKTFVNIDLEILDELSDLFMGIW